MAEVAAEFMKPNDRLTSFERLEIYNRMYWFRLIGVVRADSPGLSGLLGERKFDRLVQAYLARHPSRSFTLRNLCSRLPAFVRAEPRWTAPHSALAFDIARFEWAQTVAFDGESSARWSSRRRSPGSRPAGSGWVCSPTCRCSSSTTRWTST